MRLTNKDISENYRESEFWLMKSDFLAAFSYCAISQSPYDLPDITEALKAFDKHVSGLMPMPGIPRKFVYEELSAFIGGRVFEAIPEIEKLNHSKVSEGPGYDNRHSVPHPDYDFIDLDDLSRNVFYMILRICITQGTYDNH
jgi:hypothetical protein